MKNLMIIAIVVLGIIGCKKEEPEIITVTEYVEVSPTADFDGSCFESDTLWRIRENSTTAAVTGAGMCFLSDSAKLDIGLTNGYYGYTYDNDSLYLFEVNGRNSISGKVNWINEDDFIFDFAFNKYSYRGRFNRK